MATIVTVQVRANGEQDCLLAPTGLDTPHELCEGVEVEGACCDDVIEIETGQRLLSVQPEADIVTFRYSFSSGGKDYPDRMFVAHDSRFTRAAEALVEEASGIGSDKSGLDRMVAIARATADRFTYGHPEETFNEGMQEVPALGCGVAQGSCIDINTYFIASLRAAGFEAGYLTGYFFPEEKGDWCEDAHCWVATRLDGEIHEWDIAHHLKLGRKDVEPGLNPKPGVRHAVAHSMGLTMPDLSVEDMKLISQPVWVSKTGEIRDADMTIRRSRV